MTRQERCTFNVGLAPGQRCGRCGFVEPTREETAVALDALGALGAEEVAPGVYVVESGSLDEDDMTPRDAPSDREGTR